MKSPTQKRMVDPVGLGDAKFFADKKKRRKKVEREQPLEGLKKTQPSQDDGQLEQLFTVHDSTSIPKPVGGRKLMPSEKDGMLKELLKGQKHKSESLPMMQIMEYASIGLTLFVLVLQFSIFQGSGADGWQVFYAGWCTFLVLVCVFFGQCFSGGKNRRLWISLLIIFGSWMFWNLGTLLP